ncbi:DUF5908 family protein [Aquimarina longa]|uniref:DUF5908 family protein n=1 Tax=Aquimarina longa TaxID=1080221 RepID=UPI000AB4CA0E|nr:DUF5908 family protein [Aquimarina longa]
MPIEIKELHVRVHTDSTSIHSSSDYSPQGKESNYLDQMSHKDVEEMISKQFKNKKER